MFSTGQMIFGGIFFVAFVIVVTVSYRKDKTLHKKQYKGSVWVLIGFLVFVAFLVLTKYLLKQ